MEAGLRIVRAAGGGRRPRGAGAAIIGGSSDSAEKMAPGAGSLRIVPGASIKTMRRIREKITTTCAIA